MKISYSFDPEDAVSRSIGKFVFGQWRSFSEMVAIGVVLFLLYGVSHTILYILGNAFPGTGVDSLSGALILWIGITLGLVGAYLVMVFVSRYRDLVSERELELGAYRRGPVKVEIGPEGVSTRAPGQARQIAWVSVRGLVSTPLGLALRFDERDFIPVADDKLPEGTDRAALQAAIKEWRGSLG